MSGGGEEEVADVGGDGGGGGIGSEERLVLVCADWILNSLSLNALPDRVRL